MSATLVVLTAQSGGRLAAVTSTYIVMVTAAFIALVVLAGFPIAVPPFVFFYLVAESREKLGVSLVFAAAAWGDFHLLFERLLHFPFEAGLIREWFQ